jgi:hypothetical protein
MQNVTQLAPSVSSFGMLANVTLKLSRPGIVQRASRLVQPDSRYGGCSSPVVATRLLDSDWRRSGFGGPCPRSFACDPLPWR